MADTGEFGLLVIVEDNGYRQTLLLCGDRLLSQNQLGLESLNRLIVEQCLLERVCFAIEPLAADAACLGVSSDVGLGSKKDEISAGNGLRSR